MRLLIDMQALQSESRNRGIGRYTDHFVQALIKQASNKHEILLLFNGEDEALETTLSTWCQRVGSEQIHLFASPGKTAFIDSENRWRRQMAERLREDVIARLHPDWVLLTSLFEGLVDSAVLSVKSWRHIPTAAILYDLIPMLYPNLYLKNDAVQNWYKTRLEALKTCDLLLAISCSTAIDARLYLGEEAPPVESVLTGGNPLFRKGLPNVKHLKRYGLADTPYLLAVGSYEARKNFEGIIRAYTLLPKNLRQLYRLVIVGNIPPERMVYWDRLSKGAITQKQIIVTGMVSDAILLSLYRGATLLLQPSFYEGFGLPVLEAMQCGVPALVANRGALPEVVGDKTALLDPFNPTSMAQIMTEILDKPTLYEQLRQKAEKRASLFCWEAVAKRALFALERYRKPLEDQGREITRTLIWETQSSNAPNKESLSAVLRAVSINQRTFKQWTSLVQPLKKWRIEGPFDSSYSLALLNRETALALHALGMEVTLRSVDGPGEFVPKKEFLARNKVLEKMWRRGYQTGYDEIEVVSRNLYPPYVADLSAPVNMLHHYAWEEGGFPQEWAEAFNHSLQAMTVISRHVEKILIDHGVTVPKVVSGCGVDHWERITPLADHGVKGLRTFRFLHVSSCFPRKGADVLLDAYGEAFTIEDDVTLVIKTFPNPHNQIADYLTRLQANNAHFPHVILIEEDWSSERLKALYQACHVLVAPSRAEGFGLPLAEAMLSDLAVVTTGWGGQLDFCDETTAWLIDYRFEWAQTHFHLPGSVWAEPNKTHLAEILQNLYRLSSDQRIAKSRIGAQKLKKEMSWQVCTQKLVDAASTLPFKSHRYVKIGWMSSYKVPCGIAEYSEQLIRGFSRPPVIYAAQKAIDFAENETTNIFRCWHYEDSDFHTLLEALERDAVEVLIIQFNYAFFDFMAFRSFLQILHTRGVKTVVTLHATQDADEIPHKKLAYLAPVLKTCARLLVHTPADMNRLKTLGIVENVTLFPHGVPVGPRMTSKSYRQNGPWRLATYGFALPHKGLLQTIEATALLLKKGYDVRLHMFNARYPVGASDEIIEKIQERIGQSDLLSKVELETTFLEESDVLQRLAEVDLVVFAYQKTGESSSAAVRTALAAGCAVAVTPLDIFDDVSEAVYCLPGTDVMNIYSGIQKLLDQPEYLHKLHLQAQYWSEKRLAVQLGRRLENMCHALSEC